MKKLLVIITLFIITIGSMSVKESFSLLDYFEGEYYSYSLEPLTDESIYLGSCYMNMGKENQTSLSRLVGESMIIYNFEPASAISTLDAEVIKTEYLDGGATVIYCYTDKISRVVKLDGENINLQIAYYESYSVIGWPVILGSF